MRLRFILTGIAIMLFGYGVVWYQEASAIRNHVDVSLLKLRQDLKQTNPNMRVQWDDISLAGFPFAPSAIVQAPTLSMVYHGESYSVGFDALHFSPGGIAGVPREGVYIVAPKTHDMRAMFAQNGSAPEQYHIEWDSPVQLKLLAYNPEMKSQRCVPGQRCLSAPSQAYALSHMRVTLPASLLLLAGHNQVYKPIQFRFNDLQRAAVAQERPIPADMTHPLQLFVGMLREAHIFSH